MQQAAVLTRGHGIHPAATTESTIEEFIASEFKNSLWRKPERGAKGPLPLIIGVTGHRDLRAEDTPRIEGAVRSEFERLEQLYPTTPFVLLSALAEGADRLVAKVALEQGMRLIAVLPMPISVYETDFDEPSRKEFYSLLQAAEHFFELPLMDGLQSEDVAEHGKGRAMQYARVGAHLSAHSTILLALWDGIHLNKMGGTSQVVRFKLEGIPTPFAPAHSELECPGPRSGLSDRYSSGFECRAARSVLLA